MNRRRQVFISAFACEPGYGSEPEVGWRWVLQMARFHEVTVLTHPRHRAEIERELARRAPHEPRPDFRYFDGGKWALCLRGWFGKSAVRPYYVWWQRAAWRVVRGLHREKDFDLLHHVTFAGCRYPTALWGHGVPVVWGPVGGMESSPLLLSLRLPVPLLFFEFFRLIDNAIAARPGGKMARRAARSALVLASTRETSEAFGRLGVSAILQPTVAVDPELVTARSIVPPSGPLRLLFVGRVLAVKGLSLGLHALAESGTDAELTIIGAGPSLADTERLARKLGLGDRVNFLGRLPHDLTLQRYKDFHVFFFPSLHDSGAFAVLEAMSSGLPVICIDSGGPAMSVTPECGIRVKPGGIRHAIRGLADAIRGYDADRALVARHGTAARKEVQRRYRWDQQGDLMAQRYEQVWSNSAGPALCTRSARPTVSIVTPSFRQLDWLKVCAASIADQKGVDVEHIVQDAGTGAELETWAASQPKMKLFCEADTGMYDAIQRGFRRSNGEILGYLNCDEQYLPGALARVADYFARNPAVQVLFGDALLVDENGHALSYRRIVRPLGLHTRLDHLGTLSCAMFFRRSLVAQGSPFPTQYRAIGDAVFVWSLLAAGQRTAALGAPLSVFTFTGENLGQTLASEAEARTWAAGAGGWARLLRPAAVLVHRVRKAAAGAYRYRDVEYAIYTRSSLDERVSFHAGEIGWQWPEAPGAS